MPAFPCPGRVGYFLLIINTSMPGSVHCTDPNSSKPPASVHRTVMIAFTVNVIGI